MKRNIYSYSKLWMILFVLMGTACTNQVEDAIPVSDQPIGFSVQSDWKEIPNTRLNDVNGTMTFTGGDQIQIFGLHTYFPDGVKKVQKFMYDEKYPNSGQIVIYDDKSNSWNYTPKRFWPKQGDLLFLASYPQNSIHNDGVNEPMIYDQTDNPLRRDLLWGVSDKDCASAQNRKNNVEITMKHALAKVNIILDNNSWGNIGTVIVSAYKTGHFIQTKNNGIPDWQVDDKTSIPAVFGFYDLIRDNSGATVTATVFILPGKITGFQMFGVPHDKEDAKRIDASDEIFDRIKNLTFEAGMVYNLKISKSNGVRKKNTNSRSIAMSVRCVSE
mgnify:CR=1 FL=1